MTASTARDDIPQSVLDRAFAWAVVLGSGTAGPDERRAFEAWRAQSAQNRVAWQRVEAIENEFASARAASAGGAAALNRVAEGRARRRRRFAIGLRCLLPVALIAGLLASWLPGPSWEADHVTDVGERRTIPLPSGAIVHLNSDTAIDIARGDDGVTVHLHHGEMLVDSGRAGVRDKPSAATMDGRFTPLGTRFVVTRGEAGTELAVIHGHVAMAPRGGGATVEAAAGTHWRVGRDGIERRAANGLVPGAWVDGIVDADNARLGDVLDALDRHHGGLLRYDSAIADMRVTGLFRVDDPQAALTALERSLPVRVDRTTDWWVRVRAE